MTATKKTGKRDAARRDAGVPLRHVALTDAQTEPLLRPVPNALVRGLSHQILRTDIAGMPLEWIDYREAVRLYHMRQVAYSCGTLLYRLRGGECDPRLSQLVKLQEHFAK